MSKQLSLEWNRFWSAETAQEMQRCMDRITAMESVQRNCKNARKELREAGLL